MVRPVPPCPLPLPFLLCSLSLLLSLISFLWSPWASFSTQSLGACCSFYPNALCMTGPQWRVALSERSFLTTLSKAAHPHHICTFIFFLVLPNTTIWNYLSHFSLGYFLFPQPEHQLHEVRDLLWITTVSSRLRMCLTHNRSSVNERMLVTLLGLPTTVPQSLLHRNIRPWPGLLVFHFLASPIVFCLMALASRPRPRTKG